MRTLIAGVVVVSVGCGGGSTGAQVYGRPQPAHTSPTGSMADVVTQTAELDGYRVRRIDGNFKLTVTGTGSFVTPVASDADREALRAEILRVAGGEGQHASGFGGPGLNLDIWTWSFADLDGMAARVGAWMAAGDRAGVVSINAGGVAVAL